MPAPEEVLEPADLERRVECQEGPHQVRLVPCPSLADPGLRVLEGEEDVVHVDPDAGLQPRQYLEHEVVDVGAGLDHVGRVDEEHVAVLEPVEDLRRHVLHRDLVDAHAGLVSWS